MDHKFLWFLHGLIWTDSKIYGVGIALFSQLINETISSPWKAELLVWCVVKILYAMVWSGAIWHANRDVWVKVQFTEGTQS